MMARSYLNIPSNVQQWTIDQRLHNIQVEIPVLIQLNPDLITMTL
jgi:hypothetical protein